MSLPIFGCNTPVLANQFLGVGLGAVFASEFFVDIAEPQSISQLRVRPRVVGAGLGAVTYTLRHNGVDTELAVTIPALSVTPATDFVTVGDVEVRSGDTLSLQVSFSGVVVTGHSDVTAVVG